LKIWGQLDPLPKTEKPKAPLNNVLLFKQTPTKPSRESERMKNQNHNISALSRERKRELEIEG